MGYSQPIAVKLLGIKFHYTNVNIKSVFLYVNFEILILRMLNVIFL